VTRKQAILCLVVGTVFLVLVILIFGGAW